MNLEDVESVSGLPDKELETLRRLVTIWRTKLQRNGDRYEYYCGKNPLKDFGISIPPKLTKVETVIGWPAKAVDALAVRSQFDGFIFQDNTQNDLMQAIIAGNRFKWLYSQATRSELIHSAAMVTVSAGRGNEPPAVISAYSLLFSAGEWDRRKKRIANGLTVVDTKRDPVSGAEEPTWVNLYTDTATFEIKCDEVTGNWTSRRVPHKLGRPMIEPLVFRPSLERPFGISRISRAVMSITDSAVREALRTEVGAELYTTPQKYILGADEDLLKDKEKWEAYIGTIMAITRDEDGNIPQVGMFGQGTMQPHMDYMRSLAARFSGETSIPISELGVIHDNPASAEAIFAAKESLVCEAEDLNQVNGDALVEVAKMALAVAGGKRLDQLDEQEKSVMPRFKSPAKPSIVSQADAMVKVISALPYVAESDVALEELGFNEEQINRLKSAKNKAEAKAMIAAQMQKPEPQAPNASMYEVSSILKSYRSGRLSMKNALALFRRVGIEEDEARDILADETVIDGGGGVESA